MFRFVMSVLFVALLAPLVGAEPLTEKEAKKLLFSHKGFKIEINQDSGLDPVQLGYVQVLVKTREF